MLKQEVTAGGRRLRKIAEAIFGGTSAAGRMKFGSGAAEADLYLSLSVSGGKKIKTAGQHYPLVVTVSPNSPAGSDIASACGRGVHRTPAT